MSRLSYEQRHSGVRDHFVYRLYAVDGAALYIGCTNRPIARFRDLRGTHPAMCGLVHRISMVGPLDFYTARELERAEIKRLQPSFNQVHRRAAYMAALRPSLDADDAPREWTAAS